MLKNFKIQNKKKYDNNMNQPAKYFLNKQLYYKVKMRKKQSSSS